jgi:hypothetical protein
MVPARTPLLMEFGPYGPSLRGTSGFSVPMSRSTAFPFHMDQECEKKRQEAALRRRERLQELAREFARCPSDKKKKRRSAARTPGLPEPVPSRML